MKHNLLYINCPICGKQLLNLNEPMGEDKIHWYWCDQCEIDITIDPYQGKEDKAND